MSTPATIDQLQTLIRGRLITPGDADYDALRRVAAAVDRRPAVIARVADAGDIGAVIGFAREAALPLAVRSGGHSSAGHGVVEGGVVIDVRDMRDLEIDVAGRTAWAETGLTAGEYTAAVDAHGLATGFGDTGSVGIGGITLGGGIGYLVRAHGLTIDSLLAAEIVTADGALLRTDAQTHPDLFWAIRGGGGNFGVATRFQFRLHDVGQIVGGMLVLPATAETVAGFMAAAESAPEDLSTIANVMNCPPMPFVPEEHHGQVVILGMLCHTGTVEAGEAAMTPFRALTTPIADMVRPIAYAEMYPPEDPDFHPTATARTLFMDSRRSFAWRRRIVERLEASDAAMRVVQLRALGGAAARVPVEATAYAHRQSRILATVVAFYDGPDDRVARGGVGRRPGRRRSTRRDGGAYVNFLADEGEARIRAAYPGATWDRLRAVKARYRPDEPVPGNQNIPPAPASDR